MKKIMALMTMTSVLFLISLVLVSPVKAQAGSWTTKAPLLRPLDSFGMTAANGKIYAVGGGYESGVSSYWVNTCYEYDPINDQWATKAPMSISRSHLAVVSVNGKIYAIGGATGSSGGALSTNEEYDPVSNSWTLKAQMPTPRNWISAAVVNGKIYIIGGSDNAGGIFSMNEVYDPLTDTWTIGRQCPHACLAYGMGVVNNKIYVIGGRLVGGSTTLNEEYDPQTDTWTTKASMPTARNGLAVAVANNKIYAIGGATDFNPWTNILSVVEEYDPSTDAWRTVQSMSIPRFVLSAAAINGKIYAIGGKRGVGQVDLNEVFSIQTRTVNVIPDSGFASTTVVGSGFSNNSKVTITWDGTTIPPIPYVVTTDASGNFAAMISVPTQTAPDPHTVNATDETGNWATASFTVIDMKGDKGDTGLQGSSGDPQLVLIAFSAGASILAICLASIALFRKRA